MAHRIECGEHVGRALAERALVGFEFIGIGLDLVARGGPGVGIRVEIAEIPARHGIDLLIVHGSGRFRFQKSCGNKGSGERQHAGHNDKAFHADLLCYFVSFIRRI